MTSLHQQNSLAEAAHRELERRDVARDDAGI